VEDASGAEAGTPASAEAEGRVPPGSVRARRLTPDDALLEYLADHGMRRVSKRLVSTGVLDVVATAIPGVSDILVLGKVKQMERAEVADLILVDAPATGHAMTFLTSARGLLDAARSGPVRSQAVDVVELLADPGRCQVLLVTLPEEMPVNEVVEAAYGLEDRVGVSLAPVVVNACLDERPGVAVDPTEAARQVGVTLDDVQRRTLTVAAQFRRHRFELQQRQLERLTEALPLPQLRLPAVSGNRVGPAELAILAAALGGAVDRLPQPTGDRP
jgi:anion-transporting  ArsA/GET3 family ATPase